MSITETVELIEVRSDVTLINLEELAWHHGYDVEFAFHRDQVDADANEKLVPVAVSGRDAYDFTVLWDEVSS